uniref:SAP domain-containing protein n=1 Tax=Echinostoma caproni TaxID=27848 RepID=A0A183A114_9TREM
LRRIRDFVDCKQCLENREIMETLGKKQHNGSVPMLDYQLFRERVKQHLKINRCQAKRVFEILQLYLLPRTEVALKRYRNALEKRISKFYERSRVDSMCGRTVDRRHQDNTPEGIRLFNEVAEKCFTTQLEEHVNADLEAYQVIVAKLDRDLGVPEIS